MRIAFVADGHSPIAQAWMDHFIRAGDEVHLISTYPCLSDPRLASQRFVPVAFSGLGDPVSPLVRPRGTSPLDWLRTAAGIRWRVVLRHWLGPLTIRRAAAHVRVALSQIGPDLVHAMRVPFEGMVAAAAQPAAPLVCSTWGNDFTFHARATPAMASATRRTMQRVDALHVDCRRDLRLAAEWGLRAGCPSIVLPGNGGVQRTIFHPVEGAEASVSGAVQDALRSISENAPVVINPRGFRVYVRHDTFFRMIPHVLASIPEVRFLCPAMAAEPLAERWVRAWGISERVVLLPRLSAEGMAAAFRRAAVVVSLGVHDGTPNTLLEAMACGCVPVAGDLESIREWIDPEVNGLLVDSADAHSVAEAVKRALTDRALVDRSRQTNARLIAERADYPAVMRQAEEFYSGLIAGN